MISKTLLLSVSLKAILEYGSVAFLDVIFKCFGLPDSNNRPPEWIAGPV